MAKYKKVKLGEVTRIQGGYAFKSSEFIQNGVPVIRIGNLNGELVETNRNIAYAEQLWDENPCYRISQDDILVAMSGATVGKIGKYNYAKKALLNQRVGKVSPIKEKLDNSFLFSFLKSEYFMKKVISMAAGCAQPNISNKQLEIIEIPLPTLEEQKKIAEILDKASELISLRKKQIEKLELLVKAKFVEMFGDPIANEKKFKIHSLMDCYDKEDAIKCGPFGSALKKDEYIESGIPVWNMDNITKQGGFIKTANLWIALEKYHELKSYNVHNGDIIISRAGTVGKMCVVSSEYENSIISTNLIRLRLNEKILPLYFVMLINVHGNKVCQLRTGGDNAFTHMNTGVLNSIEIPLPPLDLQNQFASFVGKVEQQKTELQHGLEKLELNYKALMQQYFGGIA